MNQNQFLSREELSDVVNEDLSEINALKQRLEKDEYIVEIIDNKEMRFKNNEMRIKKNGIEYSLKYVLNHDTRINILSTSPKENNTEVLNYEFIDKYITKILSLQELELHTNNLVSLPESIGNLTTLKRLYLQNNNLVSLPESIGNLSALQVLHLARNELVSLPESIGNIILLEGLYLSDNQLVSLPESIGNITALQQLCLQNNHLVSLPESIGNLSALRILYLDNNELVSLPKSIGNLTALNKLDLHYNSFMMIYPSIKNNKIIMDNIDNSSFKEGFNLESYFETWRQDKLIKLCYPNELIYFLKNKESEIPLVLKNDGALTNLFIKKILDSELNSKEKDELINRLSKKGYDLLTNNNNPFKLIL